MTTERRKAAIAAYKERKAAVGVFAVRCGPASAVWVGQTRDLEKVGSIRISYAHCVTGRIPAAAARTARGVGCRGSTAR